MSNDEHTWQAAGKARYSGAFSKNNLPTTKPGAQRLINVFTAP